MSATDLSAIRTKFRRITRSPSPAQVSDDDIDQYINTFILYDMPMHLRQWNLRKTFTWYCEPYIDTYYIDTPDTANQLYNFINLYNAVYMPVYIGGYQAYYTQSRQELFNMYPQVRALQQIGQGDGTTTTFTGTLQSVPVTRDSVLFDSIDANSNGLVVHDDGSGLLITTDNIFSGTIDYVLGTYSVTFQQPPASGQAVNAQTLPYVAARPQTLCFYDNTFILRPVPDQPYAINFEVDVLPTEFISSAPGQNPDVKQWWQYIAIGAARKLFQDRMDMDSVNLIEDEYRTQEALVERRTLIQLANQRSQTIYVAQTIASGNWGGWGFY